VWETAASHAGESFRVTLTLPSPIKGEEFFDVNSMGCDVGLGA